MENLVVQLLCRLHLASHLLLLNQVAVKHKLKIGRVYQAYDAFFVDESKSALKNDKFGDLENLKKLLDKLEGSE